MTVKNRRIKSVHLSHSVVATAGESVMIPSADSWIPQEDITIIGCEIVGEAIGLNEFDSGYLSGHHELSRIAKEDEPGVILQCYSFIQAREVLVGINLTQVIQGNNFQHLIMFFPEGYGVDIDEGEPIYLNVTRDNTMANDHSIATNVVVWYVDRG